MLRQIASGAPRTELTRTLRQNRTVYQDAGETRIERIERDGSRTIGRLVNRRFVADEPRRRRPPQMSSRRNDAKAIRERVAAASLVLVAAAGRQGAARERGSARGGCRPVPLMHDLRI